MVDLTLIPIRIRNIRKSMRLSQEGFAKACGMTQAQVSAYEIGKAYPTLESALKICAAARVSITSLIEDRDAHITPLRRATEEEMALWVIEKIGLDKPALDRVRGMLIGLDYTSSRL